MVNTQTATDQVLVVRARLVQEDPRVIEVATMCALGPENGHFWSVARLTAAIIYVACGLSITKCRKVVKEARMSLRGHRRNTERHAARYEQRLLENAIVLAKRTTIGRQRKSARSQ